MNPTKSNSTAGAPKRPDLLIAQLKALLRNPDAAKAASASDRLIDRFMRDAKSHGPDAVQESANTLMEGLLPQTFDRTFWRRSVSPSVKDALGPYTALFSTLCTHVGEGLLANAVLTLSGTPQPDSGAPKATVVLRCDSVGCFSPSQWADAQSALGTLAPLLMGIPNNERLVRRVLLATSNDRDTVAATFYRVLSNTEISPSYRDALLSVAERMRPKHLPNFCKLAIASFPRLAHANDASEALKAVADLPLPLLDDVLAKSKQSPAAAAWVMSLSQVLHQLPSSAHKTALVRGLLPFATQATLEDTPLAHALAKQLGVLTPDELVSLADVAQTLLRPALKAAAVPTIVNAFLPITAERRASVAQAIAPVYKDTWNVDTLSQIAFGLAPLPTDRQSSLMLRLEPLFVEGVSHATLARVVEGMAERTPAQAQEVFHLMHRALSGNPSAPMRTTFLHSIVSMRSGAQEALTHLAHTVSPTHLPEIMQHISSRPGHEEHIARALQRLISDSDPRPVAVSPAVALAMVAVESIWEREVALGHMLAMGFHIDTPAQTICDVMSLLLAMSSSERAPFVRAAKRLLTPAIRGNERLEVLQMMRTLPVDLLPDFVFSCQWGKTMRKRNARPTFAAIVDMHQAYKGGYRPAPNAVNDAQSVHRTNFSQRASESIKILRSRYPNPPSLTNYIASVKAYIDDLEKRTPPTDPLRYRQPGHSRTGFEEMRHALYGGADRYCSFKDNSEEFQVVGGPSIRVGDLGNLIWQAIEDYPRFAKDAPRTQADVDAAKEAMKRNYATKLKECLENNSRVCYAGKTIHVLEAPQGFIKDVGVDDWEADADGEDEADETLPHGKLLTWRTTTFANKTPEPSVEDVEAFIGSAVVSAELQWSVLGNKSRNRFLEDLREYVELTYDDFAEAYPNFWTQPALSA